MPKTKDIVRPRKDVASELGKHRTLSPPKDAEQANKRCHFYLNLTGV